MSLKKEELKQINGGGWIQVTGVIVGIFTFLAGVIDGFLRPTSCEK